MVKSQLISIDSLECNKGQIKGLPGNPKFIRDDNFKKLKESVKATPVMSACRELIVYPKPGTDKYVIIAGNHRYKAMKDLGVKEIPCKIVNAGTDTDTLKAYAMLDNGEFGKWDYDILANLFDDEMLELYNVDASAWRVKEQDFDNSGKELDLDSFDEDMKLEIKLLPDQMLWVRTKLAQINASPELAVLELTGWTEAGYECDMRDPDKLEF